MLDFFNNKDNDNIYPSRNKGVYDALIHDFHFDFDKQLSPVFYAF